MADEVYKYGKKKYKRYEGDCGMSLKGKLEIFELKNNLVNIYFYDLNCSLVATYDDVIKNDSLCL